MQVMCNEATGRTKRVRDLHTAAFGCGAHQWNLGRVRPDGTVALRPITSTMPETVKRAIRRLSR